jgi:type IV secretory pathway VirJ component
VKRWIKAVLGACAMAVIAFALWLGHIGYFGGPVFVEMPARSRPAAHHSTVAVVFSGDMGFQIGMGPQIAQRFVADGVPVLGVSSLVYFRHERTPAEVRALITEASRKALAFSHADRLILIGQSFGADMLHVGLTGLPADLRKKVQMVGLVVPGETVIYRASPSELFNWATPDALALPTAAQLTWAPVVCIQGADETDSLCPQLSLPNVKQIALPGGHPLHRDADTLYATLRAEMVSSDPTRPNITKSSESRHLGSIATGA